MVVANFDWFRFYFGKIVRAIHTLKCIEKIKYLGINHFSNFPYQQRFAFFKPEYAEFEFRPQA